MSKAAELAALIGSQSAQTDRNFFINGAMQVNQRGSVNTSDGSNVYSLDRWLTFLRGGPAATLSQSTDVPTGQGFANSFKLDVTTADALGTASDFCKVSQKMEGQNCQRLAKGTSSAKRVTLQFWVKSTITGTYIIELFDDDNTRQVSQAYTISSSNTWEHKTLTFPADTSGALADDNGNSFEVVWGLGMGSTYTSGTLNTSWANNTQANRFVGQVNALSSTDNEFYLTGCQLEIGDVATPFEHRSFADELSRCQRYFQHWNLGGTYQNGGGFSAMLYSSSLTFGTIPFMCEMRAAPTGSISAANTWQFLNSSDAPHSVNTISIYAASKVSASFQCDPSTASSTPNVSETGGGLLWPGNTNSNDATVSMDAEL
jgi:hypothetical protein